MFRYFLLLIIPVSLVVWSYNYWAIGCGRCSYADFWRLDPHTLLWSGFIVAVLAVWLYLRYRNQQPSVCPECKRSMDTQWSYCPDCGHCSH